MQNNSSRLNCIGASEIGFIGEYTENLYEKGIIDHILKTKFESLFPVDDSGKIKSFLPTRYSTLKRLELKDEKQLEALQEFIASDHMKRGKACEMMVMQQWLHENPGWELVDEQVRLERHLDGVDIKLIVTIDFVVTKDGKRKIVEVKTKELNPSSDWSVNAWEKVKKEGCPFHNELQVNMQMLFSDIHEAEVITGAIICRSEGKGKNKVFTYEISDNHTDKFIFNEAIGNAIKQAVFWFDYEQKNNYAEIEGKKQEDKIKADLEIDAFLEDFTATKEEVASPELSVKIARFQELQGFLEEGKKLKEEIKLEVEKIMGVSRKLKLISNSFELNAKFTKPTFLDEAGIQAEIRKAKENLELTKLLEVGDAKSKPSLRWEIESKV